MFAVQFSSFDFIIEMFKHFNGSKFLQIYKKKLNLLILCPLSSADDESSSDFELLVKPELFTLREANFCMLVIDWYLFGDESVFTKQSKAATLEDLKALNAMYSIKGGPNMNNVIVWCIQNSDKENGLFG